MIKYNIVVCCYDKMLVNGTACAATFTNTTCKPTEDGVLTPKHVAVILILILHYLLVHMSV